MLCGGYFSPMYMFFFSKNTLVCLRCTESLSCCSRDILSLGLFFITRSLYIYNNANGQTKRFRLMLVKTQRSFATSGRTGMIP